METQTFVLGAYALILFGLGWLARTRWSAGPAGFFLADRGLSSVVFLATMAATNFSAFTVFGASGAGYRDGYAFYPLVGFGTGFMALSFWLIGRQVRRQGLHHGSLTPPDLVRSLYGNRLVSTVFAVIIIVFTLPYLALQPMAAGYALSGLFGWEQAWGAGLVTLVICIYTVRGGLRAVAWTDAFQGLVMILVLILALVLTARNVGGLAAAGRSLLADHPELFQRPGAGGRYGHGIWLSYIVLWFFCDPMFPQLFQRFLAARNERVIRRTMLAYPFICSLVFLLPITIGVLGRLSHPGLTGAEADRILPLLAAGMDSAVLGALVIACGLAALMSTMDSQLLTLSSIFSQDLYGWINPRRKASAWPGRLFVILLSAAGLALAVNPPGTILAMASQAFTGLAVLFPTVMFGLSPKWRSVPGALLSMGLGEGAVALDYFHLLPKGGFMAVIPVMIAAFAGYLIPVLTTGAAWRRLSATLASWSASPMAWAFVAVFVLSQDWWRWGRTPGLLWGWPSWILWFWGLSLAQTVLMWRWTAPADDPGLEPANDRVSVTV